MEVKPVEWKEFEGTKNKGVTYTSRAVWTAWVSLSSLHLYEFVSQFKEHEK